MRSRRIVAVLLALVAFVAVLVAVFVRSRSATNTPLSQPARGSAEVARSAVRSALPSTSEELIAAALQARKITYEQSLLARAYALYDDPRLPREYRSPVIDWEAGTALSLEINDNKDRLSAELLAQLAPFSARPNDPISIFNRPRTEAATGPFGPVSVFNRPRVEVVKARYEPISVFNRPRAEVVKAQFSPQMSWQSRLVPGTRVRLWIQGPQQDLDKYVPMMESVWSVFADYFPLPKKDYGQDGSKINPDNAIDVYLVHGWTVDPRSRECAELVRNNAPDLEGCKLLGKLGRTEPDPMTTYHTPAYCLISIDGQADDVLTGTMAHELAHVTQMQYDNHEVRIDTGKWLVEGSASWVEFKVLKSLNLTPRHPYEFLENKDATGIFDQLQRTLDTWPHYYGTWLFFFYASTELGDRVVTNVWEKAALPRFDGTEAVNEAIPFHEHFPRFAVRNWNRDSVRPQYKDDDDTFPPGKKPMWIDPQNLEDPLPPVYELRAAFEPLAHLTTSYYHFKFRDDVRRVTFENLFTDLPDAHVWGIAKIGEWKPPEDWTSETQRTFCRDLEDLQELVIIVSNSNMTDPLPVGHPKPRLLTEKVGCPYVEGWARTTLRVKDANQDMTYTSSRTELKFKPRSQPNRGGNVEYDLLPTTMTWTASGRKGDCTVAGTVGVNITSMASPGAMAYGYLNVVGLNNGNFHSVIVRAFNPNGLVTKTCPGGVVTKEPVDAGLLLQILSEPNKAEGNAVVYTGKQIFDPYNPLSSLSAGTASPPNLPGGIQDMPQVRDALRKLPVGRVVYTFEWELHPKNGVTPPAGPAPLR